MYIYIHIYRDLGAMTEIRSHFGSSHFGNIFWPGAGLAETIWTQALSAQGRLNHPSLTAQDWEYISHKSVWEIIRSGT